MQFLHLSVFCTLTIVHHISKPCLLKNVITLLLESDFEEITINTICCPNFWKTCIFQYTFNLCNPFDAFSGCSSCNLSRSRSMMGESLFWSPNLSYAQKLINRLLTTVYKSVVPVSPYNMQLGVNLKVFSMIRKKLLWKISTSRMSDIPQTSQPYKRIGVTTLSNSSHVISMGSHSFLALSRRPNMAFLDCIICCPMAFFKWPIIIEDNSKVLIFFFHHHFPVSKS